MNFIFNYIMLIIHWIAKDQAILLVATTFSGKGPFVQVSACFTVSIFLFNIVIKYFYWKYATKQNFAY